MGQVLKVLLNPFLRFMTHTFLISLRNRWYKPATRRREPAAAAQPVATRRRRSGRGRGSGRGSGHGRRARPHQHAGHAVAAAADVGEPAARAVHAVGALHQQHAASARR